MRGRNEKRQAQKTSPRKTKKGEAKIAVKRPTKNGLFFFWVLSENSKSTKNSKSAILVTPYMAFFNSAITVLQTLVIALGAGLGIWGAINLLEGYGNDNPGAKSQGQLMAGGGVALIGTTLVPLLSGLFG